MHGVDTAWRRLIWVFMMMSPAVWQLRSGDAETNSETTPTTKVTKSVVCHHVKFSELTKMPRDCTAQPSGESCGPYQ